MAAIREEPADIHLIKLIFLYLYLINLQLELDQLQKFV